MDKSRYDKSKIGKQIGRGGDRKIFTYKRDHVIKFSTLTSIIGKEMHDKFVRDYILCKKYLGDFIVETANVSSPTKAEDIEIQPYIQGERLAMHHMNNPVIRSQLTDISNRIRHMVNEGYPTVDLVGHAGMISGCLSNVIVDESNKLRIIDATLLEGDTVLPLAFAVKMILPIIKARQNYLLNKFLR